jgi:hypothetical protein
MGRMRGIVEGPTGLRYVPSLLSEDQGRDLLERVRGLEFDEVRMQAAKYCHGSARSNSDRPATLAKSADVANRGRPSVGGPPLTLQWLHVRANPITAVRSAQVHTVRLGMTPERRHSLVRGFAVTVLGISCLYLVATVSK